MNPYIVTRREPVLNPPTEPVAITEGITSRRAVATIDEARAVIRDHIVNAGVEHGTTADPVGDTGGTVGPLPDGTVIEVTPVALTRLFNELRHAMLLPSGASTEAEIIDAYNAAQEA